MRYIAEYIRPGINKPVVGTSGVLVREYANDRNALRFMHLHLQLPSYPAGQYVVHTYPRDYVMPQRYVGTLYKQV